MSFARAGARRHVVRAHIGRIALIASLALAACGPARDNGQNEASERNPLTQSPLTAAVPWVAKLGAINGGGCSVYILTDHWVMGVRHCFNDWATSANFPLIYTSPTGVQEYIYNGPGIVRTYPGPVDDYDHDIGLLYLVNGLGANLALTGQAKLYADARHPWCSSSEPNDVLYTVAGYGRGTDVGGSDNCDDAMSTEKRINEFVLTTGQCSANTIWSSTGGAHVCTGDSGAPWLFRRDGEYLAFAHTTLRTLAAPYAQGALLIEPFLRWIRDASADVDPDHALALQYATTASGYRYGTYVETRSDPGTFADTGSMVGSTRTAHTATLLPSGKVFIAGGFTRNPYLTYLSSSEVYDPAAGTFVAGPSIGAPRYDHTQTLLPSGKVLLAGGDNASGPIASAVLYDPASNTTIATGNMATGRYDFTATRLPSGKVLIAGGVGSSGVLAAAELYDPATGAFTVAGDMRVARQRPTATLLTNGKVLIAGGWGPAGYRLNTAELYDPVLGTFTMTRNNLLDYHAGHSATVLANGKVLIAGFPFAELYDPETESFTRTGSMVALRGDHTATLLPNGNVLIAGGQTDVSLATSEVYDPATGSFLPSGEMGTPRTFHTATLMPDGRVLLAGGFNYQGIPAEWKALSSAELYDPRPFAATGGLATKRAFHTATLLPDGQVLIAGGASPVAPGNVVELATAQLFAAGNGPPTGGKFTYTGSLLTARYAHTATLLDNAKVLVVGGYNSTSQYLASAELYDPARGTFSETGSLASPRYWHTATLLPDGNVLITGGYNSASGELSSAELYDTKRRRFIATGSMGTPRAFHKATLLRDGTVLVIGGFNSSSGYLRSAERYDPATGTFAPTGSMGPSPRAFHTATLLSASGNVLITGGVASAQSYYLATAELYDPVTGTFSSLGNMNAGVGQGRATHQAVELPNGKVLITGGRTSASTPDNATALLYEPAARTFLTVGTMSAARPHGTATLLADHKTVLLPGGWNSQVGYLSTSELYR